MKKTYQIPTTLVVKLQPTRMIAVSMYGKDATGEAMGRQGGSGWDDDDYDDYDE